MKRLFLVALVLLGMVGIAFAQQKTMTCRGLVIDELGEPVVGATVQAKGTSTGIPTDIDGKFALKVPATTKEIQISYIGYKTLTLKAEPEMGEIKLTPDSKMLQDVVVTSSIAKTRETPVAISEITAQEIEVKLGDKELPELLNTTPGVWATPEGGGHGDAKINMRGFKAPNVAVLINGIPMNDMEWGGIYWSNFGHLPNVTSNVQTQRGLGAAIISTPSIGGTIAYTTKGLDAKKGGSLWYGTGNDGLNNIGLTLSTGLMKSGWAVTIMGGRRWANGYIQGTQYDEWSWFVNVTKKLGDKNQIALTAFGAPQWHNQRNSANLTIQEWQNVRNFMGDEAPYRYNPIFGYDNEGQQRTSARNKFHKPIISLNHIWQINEYSSLSTALYTSLASGYGYSGQGRSMDPSKPTSSTTWRSNWYATNGRGQLYWDYNGLEMRRPDGTFNYGAIQNMNEASTTGSNMVMAASHNDHQWYGLISTYKNEVMPNRLTITAGIDMRYYIGHHYNTIIDLYSGKYYIDDNSRGNVRAENNYLGGDQAWVNEKLGVGDIVYRNYYGYANQEGVYGQAEGKYLDGRITTILAGSFNVTTYQRRDKFYYDAEHAWSVKKSYIGGTIKGGINWNIDRYNNIFANGGYISKAPFFSNGVFISSDVSNQVNPKSFNEKIGSAEVGYSFHSPKFTMTLNGYYTMWLDQTNNSTQRTVTNYQTGERYVVNLENVAAKHMGIELNFTYLPTNWLEINGMFSWGDWRWANNVVGYYYNLQGQPISDDKGTLASSLFGPDHMWVRVEQKNVPIGDSAQSTGMLGANFRPFKGFRIGADWLINFRHYSDYSLSLSSNYNRTITVADPWCIPFGNELNLYASYNFKIAGLYATVYGNVNNVLNNYYVKDARTPYNEVGTSSNAWGYYSFGRTFTVRLKINF
ncbi:MAG: carboxypeptidase-like regulatory domain-containing protein [Muribaculaceae bacterium]|nr:carboxypeptidase-like regulatory domain-containing protein [Muribaculaceae bacterium]